MKRNVSELSDTLYDVLVIGGGIYGASIAWDAALRDLRVALVERSDFGSKTSSNSLKIIHGGFRYLQYGDVRRVREAVRERAILMRIAPHLIHPLPVLLPTYGHRIWSKNVLALALRLHDAIGFDRNRHGNPDNFIPAGRTVSRSECLQLASGIAQHELTGGIIFHDAQASNTERFVLSILLSAAKAGATLANYMKVTGFLKAAGHVGGVQAKDLLTGDQVDIRAKTVVNACGPWMPQVLNLLDLHPPVMRYASAINLVTRPLFHKYAVGVQGANGYRGANRLVARKRPYLFIAPWRGLSIIGTRYRSYNGPPSAFRVTEGDVRTFVDEINSSCPAADLKLEDVKFVHGGLLPCASSPTVSDEVDLAKKHMILDHRGQGVDGLFSVVGVKYTTARLVAEKTVDRLFVGHGKRLPRSRTAMTPIHGGNMDQSDTFSRCRSAKLRLTGRTLSRLIANYGSAYPEVLRYIDSAEVDANEEAAVVKAEILHGIRDEMACKLTDIVFRRTDLGSAGHPGADTLQLCADVMSAEMRWGSRRTRDELDETASAFHIGGYNRVLC
jgi:glycerol-3-phosphate dehydrogenase